MSYIPREVPEGAIRYNTDSNKMEVWIGDKWMQVAVSSPNLDGGARGLFGGGFVPSANTNVIQLGDDLLALWEAAGPHALDPSTLETKGLSTLKGVLKKNMLFVKKHALAEMCYKFFNLEPLFSKTNWINSDTGTLFK